MDRFAITAASGDIMSLFHHDKTDGKPKQITAAYYECPNKTCKQTLIGNHSIAFSCPSCTTDMKPGKTKDLQASEIAALKVLGECSHCASVISASTEALPLFAKGKGYCMVCSNTVSLKNIRADDSNENPENEDEDDTVKKNPTKTEDAEQPDMAPDAVSQDGGDGLGDDNSSEDSEDLPEGDDESDDSDENDDDDDSGSDDDSDDDDSDEDSDSDDDDSAVEADDGETSEKSGNKNTDNASNKSDNNDNKTKDPVKNTNADKPTGESDDTSDDQSKKNNQNTPEKDKSEKDKSEKDKSEKDTNNTANKSDSENQKDEKPKPEDGLVASVLAAIGDKEVDITLVPTPNRRKWYMFADEQPIMISEKGRCSEGIREHFDNDKFATAYHAATKDGNVTQDLMDDFGFKPIEVSVPVDEAIRQTVEAQVEERTKNYSLNADAFNERMTKCLGMAAVGLVKGTFKDENPVHKNLVAALHRNGLAEADSIVARAFEKNSIPLMRTLMIRATELMEKSDDSLKEISEIVDNQPMPSERAVKNTIPPAAMRTMEDERIEKMPEVEPITASMNGNGPDDYRTLFQRRK